MKLNRPNIFFISSWLPTPYNPHLGNFVIKHAHASSLFCKVFFVRIVFQEKFKAREIKIENNSSLYFIDIGLSKNKILYKFFPFLKSFRLAYEYLKVFKFINKNFSKIDIVHSNIIKPISVVALLIKFIHRVPFILSEHWTGYLDSDPYKLSLVEKILTKFVISESACVTVVSDDLKEAIKTIHNKSEIHVIPNVVDNIFFQLPLKEKSIESFKFIHISTLDNLQKNVTGIINTFIEIHQEFTNTHLTIVGENQNLFLEDYLSKKTTLKGIIDFNYNLKTDEVAYLLSNSHVLVMFSNYESFSIVIAESLALGIPVVTSRCGGLTSVLDEKFGVFIKPKVTFALKEAMQEIIVKYESYDKNLLRNFAYQFSNNVIGEQFNNIYRHVISNK